MKIKLSGFFVVISLVCFSDAAVGQKAAQQVVYHENNAEQYCGAVSAAMKKAIYYLKFRLTQNNRLEKPHHLAIVMNVDDCVSACTRGFYQYIKKHQVHVFFVSGKQQKSIQPDYDVVMSIEDRQNDSSETHAGMHFKLPSPLYDV